jgi:hypothetical protein
MPDNNVNEPLQQRVQRLRLETFFRLAAGNVTNSAFAALLIALTLFGGGTRGLPLAIWTGLALTLVVGIGVSDKLRRITSPSPEEAERRLRVRMSLGSLMALAFGTSSFLLPAGSSVPAEALLLLVLTTVATVSCLTMSVLPNDHGGLPVACDRALSAPLWDRGRRAVSGSGGPGRRLAGCSTEEGAAGFAFRDRRHRGK